MTTDRRIRYELGQLAEECAFKAVCKMLDSLLGVEPTVSTHSNGDKYATYIRNEEITGYPNEWTVAWIAPAKHHTYHKSARDRPDIVVLCNEVAIVAIEVKNWDPASGQISLHNVYVEMVRRFLGVPSGVIEIILSTSDNFADRELCGRQLAEMGINFRLIHHRSLPNTDLEPTIDEMRHVLEEFITLKRLKEKEYG
jgi:hypothetical protein